MAEKSDPAARLAAAGFAARTFKFEDISHTVFQKGNGKPVLVMHELPGLAEPAVNFADRLVAAGFQVHLPHLFGKLLEHDSLGNTRRLCVSREFARLKVGEHSPITSWLSELLSEIGARAGTSRVGAIGMCVTGAFVIPLIMNPVLRAAVAAQPAVPFSLPYLLTGLGRGDWMQQLNVSDADLENSVVRATEYKIPLLAVRFRADRVCPGERVARLTEAYSAQIQVEEYPFPSWVRAIFSPPHALLTEEYDKAKDARPTHPTREALALVCQFLRDHL